MDGWMDGRTGLPRRPLPRSLSPSPWPMHAAIRNAMPSFLLHPSIHPSSASLADEDSDSIVFSKKMRSRSQLHQLAWFVPNRLDAN